MLPLLGALLFALIGIGALVVDGGLAEGDERVALALRCWQPLAGDARHRDLRERRATSEQQEQDRGAHKPSLTCRSTAGAALGC